MLRRGLFRAAPVVLAALTLPASGELRAGPAAGPTASAADRVPFATSYGATWTARRDALTGVARIASGPALTLLSVPHPSAGDGDAALRDYANVHVDLVGVPSAQLGAVTHRAFDDGAEYFVYPQLVGGVPVVGAEVRFQMRGGRLLTFSSSALPNARLGGRFAVAAESAESRVLGYLGAGGTVVSAPSRAALPRAGGSVIRPVWVIDAEADGLRATERFYVDAETGDILHSFSMHSDGAARVLVEVDPQQFGGDPVEQPLAHAGFSSSATDADGRFEIEGNQVSLSLSGPLAAMTDMAGRAESAALDLAAAAGGLDTVRWPSTTPIEQRDAWVYVHEAIQYGLRVAPSLSYVQRQLPILVNFNDAEAQGAPDDDFCNAFYSWSASATGSRVVFMDEGGNSAVQCNNTARLPKVAYHEWGHGFHDHLMGGLIDNDDVRSISEGVGDYVACSMTNTTTMLDDMSKGDSPQQIELRQVENTNRYPDDLRSTTRQFCVNQIPCNCSVSGECETRSVPDVHHNGKIWSGAWWDLRQSLVEKYGRSGGVYLADQLHADTLRGGPTFQSAYDLAIAADDNDGDPSNGTPNSCEINSAFAAHGLAPSTPYPSQPSVRIEHDEVNTGAAGQEIEISASGTMLGDCGVLLGMTLHYAAGASFQEVAMVDTGAGVFKARIPAQEDGTVLRYFIVANLFGDVAKSAAWPAQAEEQVILVGSYGAAARFDFEDGGIDWNHGSDDLVIDDDWQIGAPRPTNLDPDSAASGTLIAGTDLGHSGTDGLYASGVSSMWLESPSFVCGGCRSAVLRFRRYLRIEAGDSARVVVNGKVVWESTGAVADSEWSTQVVDLPHVEPGDDVTVRFELSSDDAGTDGGWNVDDIEVMGFGLGSPDGSGNPAAGGDLIGGCRSGGGGAAPWWLIAALLLSWRRSRPTARR